MKKNVVMLILIIMMGLKVNAKGDITVSSSSLTIKKGEKTTFVVKAENVAGKIDIISSDENIAKVDTNAYFFDTTLNDSEVTVTVTGLKDGTTSIKVVNTDVATFDEEVLTGEHLIKVNVEAGNSLVLSKTTLIILTVVVVIAMIFTIAYKGKKKVYE